MAILGIALSLAALVVLIRLAERQTVRDLAQAVSYELSEVRAGSPVPRAFVPAIDADLSKLRRAERRKDLFLRIALPLILRENARLLSLRRTIRAAPSEVPPDVFVRFEVADGDVETLLRRVDTVPASLALAQAAVESGWGTSRFVREGRSLFGQRTWNDDGDGIAPRDADGGFKVRGFAELGRSVRAYLRNLNTHRAYAALRQARAAARDRGGTPAGGALAGYLTRYSEEGKRYVKRLRRVIRDNRLGDFDGARLAAPR